MGPTEQKYWFPAKRFGWGWGLPGTWQGRLVLVLWFAAFMAANRYLLPPNIYARLAFTAATVGMLLAVCYKKGEPPRWRSGPRG